MKSFLKEYVGVIMYTICGILIVLGSYSLLININHARYLNNKIVVSNIDSDYIKYKENVLKIENIKPNSSFISDLKTGGLYQLMPNDVLSYTDLYNLNNYFLDTIINNIWVYDIKSNNKGKNYNELMDTLINNANYIRNRLANNSNYQYNINNEYESIANDYHLIIRNYECFSHYLLEILKSGDNNA